MLMINILIQIITILSPLWNKKQLIKMHYYDIVDQ